MGQDKNYTPVRQFMKLDDVFNKEDWRFVKKTKEGQYTGEIFLVARRPVQVSNAELQNLLNQHKDMGVATTGLLVDTLRPFDNTDKVFKPYEYIWGNNRDFSDAKEPFVYQGVGRNGFVGVGPSNFGENLSDDKKIGGLWAVTSDGNRLFAPHNIHGEISLKQLLECDVLDDSGVRGERGERGNISGIRGERGKRGEAIAGERGVRGERGERGDIKTGIIREAGLYANNPKELEGNEGYILIKKPTEQELDYFNKALAAIGNRLSADNGITVLCPPNFKSKQAFFIPAGGCAECSNQRRVTAGEVGKAVLNATGINLELPEEVHRYMDIMEQRLASGMLSYKARHVLDTVKNVYDYTKGNKEITSQFFKEALKEVPLKEIENFFDKMAQAFGEETTKSLAHPDLSNITKAEVIETKKEMGK